MKETTITIIISLAVSLVTLGISAFIDTYKSKCITLGIGATIIIWVIVLFAIHSKSIQAEENVIELESNNHTPQKAEERLTIGEDSVVMGKVPPNTKVGKGSVVIGPTDNRGNTILNFPMAVGKNAKAGPGSIAIGADAGAGLPEEKSIESPVKK